MKKFFAILAFVATSVAALAVPANSGLTRVVKMKDGREVTIMLRGDETFHFFVTTDGMVVREQADGTWVQDTRDVHALWTTEFRKRNAQRIQHAERARRAMRAPNRMGNSTGTTGKKRGLLILVNFNDVKMQDSSTHAVFDQMLNDVETPYGENYGSVRQYFRDQSYGQFDVEFDVVGPVTVSNDMEYYGVNNSSGSDSHPEVMITEACELANEEYDIDFSLYDWDEDGEVENIYVTYAGKGEANGGEANTIWPHQWDLHSAYYFNSDYKNYELILDGVKINTYACGPELNGYGNISGIGTMCHEYSHCLGIPDFYDTTKSGCVDMLDWSLMSSGNYNGNGFCPAGYTAYERMFCGWLEPVELASSTSIGNMPPIEDEPVAYIIYNDNNRNEYFLLANHQQKGWDTKTKGHGMMILHVTYDNEAWTSNKVNIESGYQHMIIIPAGGFQTSNGKVTSSAKDLWPGESNNSALTDTSTPAAQLHYPNTDGKYFMHKPIEDITELDEYISFRFMGGVEIDAPTLAEAADISDHSFRATWTPIPVAASYNLILTEKGKKNSAALDALTLVEYFDNPSQLGSDGWTFTNLASSSSNGVRVGNYITTPLITDNKSGQISIFITVKPVSGTSQVVLSVLGKTGNTLTTKTFSLQQNTTSTLKYGLRGSIPDYKIKLSTNSSGTPFYLMKFYAFDGDVSHEDVTDLETPAEDKITPFIGVSSPEYVFTDLQPDRDYKLRVQTIDGDSQISAWSNEISVRTLSPSPFERGDVNEDGQLSVSDIDSLVDIILGKSPDPDFRIADVNGDGRITIADLTSLVNLILGN